MERNLHDGAQQRLVSLALAIRVARAKIGSNPEAAGELLDESSRELDEALAELRELARGLHPAILTDRGLSPALDSLAGRLPIPIEINAPADRFDPTVEATAYYIAAEALTNVVKHADASHARVAIAREAGLLRVEVTDDGCGGADPATGTGILGLRDRAEAAGGSLVVVSVPGRGHERERDGGLRFTGRPNHQVGLAAPRGMIVRPSLVGESHGRLPRSPSRSLPA